MKKIISNFKRRWKLILIVLVIGAGGLFFYFRSHQGQQIVLETVNPEFGTLTKTLEISGAVNAKEYARLRFVAGGKIVYLGAKEGDTIKKWQTIATIDKQSLQKSLEKSLNQYTSERLDWDQTLDNSEDRWLPKAEERSNDKSQLDLQNTVLDVETATIAIQNTVLSSPINGVLVSSPTNLAGVALTATDVFEVVNPSTLVFQATVDEIDIAQVKTGQRAMITLDAYPDETLETSISFISYKSSQSSTGTVFIVEFPLVGENRLEKFRIGLNGDVTIIVDEKNDILSIPLDSIIERDDKTFVQIKTSDNTTEEREIQIGLETDDRVEILSGLSEEDDVVLPE